MAVVGFGFVIVNHGATKGQCEGIATGLGWASGAARGGSGNYVGGVAKAACNPTGGDVDRSVLHLGLVVGHRNPVTVELRARHRHEALVGAEEAGVDRDPRRLVGGVVVVE